ncbi:MAG: hypothetical protein ACLP59_15050 [Bryobacteraceae bacterium]
MLKYLEGIIHARPHWQFIARFLPPATPTRRDNTNWLVPYGTIAGIDRRKRDSGISSETRRSEK